MKRILLLLAILAAAVSASVAYRYLREEWIVDDCLSGKHGSFDYSTMSCDIETNHPYVAFEVRHPHETAVGAAAIVVLTVAASVYARKRNLH